MVITAEAVKNVYLGQGEQIKQKTLIEVLTQHNKEMAASGRYWIYTNRMKTETRVDVPLLSPALTILEKYKGHPAANQHQKVFPYTSNQEVNRQLKLIAEAAGIKKYLTFHLARHKFATLLLMNGAPIETIKKLLGHTKITTTMIYAHVVNAKVGMDMEAFGRRMNSKQNDVAQ